MNCFDNGVSRIEILPKIIKHQQDFFLHYMKNYLIDIQDLLKLDLFLRNISPVAVLLLKSCGLWKDSFEAFISLKKKSYLN